VQTIRRLISFGLELLSKGLTVSPRPKTKLSNYHLDYLKSEHTLREWAHLSLAQRARMFHRTFPEIKISASHLQRIYKRLDIRYKFIQRGKKIIDYTNQYYFNLFQEMYQAVKRTRLRDKKLVWVDEAVFTFNTFSTKAWSAKH